MRRNSFTRQKRLMQEIAARASQTAADAARGQSDAGRSLSPGDTDPDTGEVRCVGLLDYTLFGDGFRLG